jgi:hypothetical protein
MSIISHQTRGALTAKNSLGDAVLMLGTHRRHQAHGARCMVFKGTFPKRAKVDLNDSE